MLTLAVMQYYTSVPVVENSLLGVAPFILASVEMEAYRKTRGRA